MTIFSTDEIRSNRVARALCDLQRGLPIAINKKYLIASVETISENNFNRIQASFKEKLNLVLPASKEYLAKDVSPLLFKDIKSLCKYNKDQYSSNHAIFQKTKASNYILIAEYHSLVKKILKIAKLLPIFLFTELNPTCDKFLKNTDIINITPQDFISYKDIMNSTVEQVVTNVPVTLKHIGKVSITMFRVMSTGEQHMVIASGNIASNKTPLVRLHSSCYTGDLLQSLQCDCNEQLLTAIKLMNTKSDSPGIIIYLAQEGRGIGLANKLRAYDLQYKGYDTVEANIQLGFDIDERDYAIAAEILKRLKIKEIKLLTNNPQKSKSLVKEGIVIKEILPLMTEMNNYNKKYMETKKYKMAHTI